MEGLHLRHDLTYSFSEFYRVKKPVVGLSALRSRAEGYCRGRMRTLR